MLLGSDTVGLFPSIHKEYTTRVVREVMEQTDITSMGISYQEAMRYLQGQTPTNSKVEN